MTAEELLRSLETQTHTQRVRAMIELGRQGDDESRAILADLAQGGFYQRFLALHSCFGSRDSAHVIRALADPSRIIRGLAARLTPLVCDDAEMQQALDATPSAVRPALLWKLRKQHRQDTIDAFLERPGIGNDAGFCAVLPFGSPDLVARLAPQFVERAKPDEWQRLARLHPTLVIQLLVRQADTATARDALLLDRVNTLLPMLAKAQPRRALALVVALQRTVPLTSITIRPLVQPLPAAVADLVLAETERINSISLGNHAHQLSTEQLIALYQNHRYTLGWQTDWFSQLPPERRLEVFTALGRLLQQGNKVPSEIVAALPQEQREREARRHVAMTWPSPYSRLTYAEYLPWDEMLAVIDPYLHTSDVGLRQAALRVLIGAVTYHRSRLGEVLGMLQTRRTEQDATRRTMLEGLGAVPLSAWRSEHLPEVEEVIRHGLNDVGLSPMTLQYMLDLLLRLLPVYPEWAAPQIATVLRERGWTSSGSSTVALPSAVELRLTQALLPLFTLWLERDEEASVLGASESWARRPEPFALALPTIEELLGRTRTREHAQRALALITKRAHQRLDTMVPALLAEDASWITFDEVSSYLLRRRQDLLTPFLSLQPSEGRWSSGRTRSLLPLSAPFAGGTASQQEQLAEALLAIITDETQESRTTTRAVKMLAFLPAVAPARVAALADDPRSVVRTTALFALGRLDTNGGLQTLLLALRDARARIAIHALRPYLLEMPPEQALANLRAVPLERVTVAKEVIRLIGELAPDAALDELLSFERRDLHRDVRVALIRTLGKYLDRPEAWVVLDRAARSTEPELALAPLSISTLTAWQLADRQRPEIIQRVLRLVAVLIDHPEREVRLEALSYCSQLEAPDDEQVLVPRLAVLARVTGSKRQDEEAEAAAKALLGVCSNQDAQLVGQLLHDFLPNRQRLEDIVGSLKGGRRARERALLPVIHAALASLAEDPITTKLCIELAVPNVPWEELAAYFGELARTNELHADALARASEMLLYENTRFSAAQLESFEAALAASDDERVRRLAFSVLMAQTRKASTWSDAHLARLQVYRADPSTLVAAAAQFTFPNEEDDDDFDDDDDDDY